MGAFLGVLLWVIALAALATTSAGDSDGRIVTLKSPAKRIVSLAPHATELLFAIGAGERLVGVSEYSDYPQAATRLPRVSSSAGVDLERVLALHPDLVIAWRFEATRGAIERMEKLGIPVFISEPRQLSEIAGSMEALGVLAGTEAQARSAAALLRVGLERLKRAHGGSAQLRVLYLISVRPLMSLNGKHMVSDAIATCGGTNVLAAAATIAPAIDAEAVLAADPDVIVAAERYPLDPHWQSFWTSRFASLRAVREGNLVAVDPALMHRQGPRMLLAVENLCRQLDAVRQRAGRGRTANREPAAMAANPR